MIIYLIFSHFSMVGVKHISEVVPGIPEILQEAAQRLLPGTKVIAYSRVNDIVHIYHHCVNPEGAVCSRRQSLGILFLLEEIVHETSDPLEEVPLLAPNHSEIFTCLGFELPEFISQMKRALNYAGRLPLTFYPF
jgi:hypothetical protein